MTARKIYFLYGYGFLYFIYFDFQIDNISVIFLFFQHFQITIQSRIYISCKQFFHCAKVMFDIIFIKSIIISNPICKFNINGWKSCFHQFQIYKQPPRSTISINKRVNPPQIQYEIVQVGE